MTSLRAQKNYDKLEPLLLEGLNSGEATSMTESNWLEIRAAVRAKLDKK